MPTILPPTPLPRSSACYWLLAILAALPAIAQTPVAGVIDANTTWTAAGSPYVLEDEVEVVGGATLTVLAGVRVEFEAGSRLLIGGEDASDTGRLLVVGTSSHRVNFVPGVPGEPAGGVELRPGAAWDADGTGSAIRFARFEQMHQPLTMREAVASLEDVVVLHAGDHERSAVVVDLDPRGDMAVRATRLFVLESANGGLSIAGGGNHRLSECRFVANAGNGLLMNMSVGLPPRPGYADVRLERCVFLANQTVDRDGAGALLFGPVVWFLEDCTFERNASGGSGGGLEISGNRGTIQSCAFGGNRSRTGGGGLHIDIRESAIEGCQFSGNSAGQNGGGVLARSPIEVRGCEFEGNSGGYGGGTYGEVMAIECDFADNFASAAGGAMQVTCTTTGFGVIGGRFEGNSATDSGGAIDFTGSYAGDEVRIEGATFIDNRADLGGAIGGIGGRPVGDGARLTLAGNHFEANIARRGGAVHVRPDALADLRLNLSAEGEAINSFRANLATTGPAIANDSAHGVEARGVCWGVPTRAAVGTRIHDGLDDPALGVVAIDPIAAGCATCRADMDGDGELTLFDFLVFQNEFDAGCP